MDTDVLIVGAGPVGLMLAGELHSRRVNYRIVEQRPRREYFCKALGVSPRTLEIFDQLGMVDDAVSRGIWLRAVTTMVNGETVARAEVQNDALPYGFISLAQYDTESLLEERLERLGGRVERGVTVTAVDAGETSVTCQLADGTRIESRYVVGCDGAHSIVRKSAGISFEGDRYPHVFVLGDVDLDWHQPHDETWKMVEMVEGEVRNVVVVVPIAGQPQRYRISMSAPPEYWDESVSLPDPPPLDLLVQFAGKTLPARASNLRWSSMYRISHRIAGAYRKGRLLLAGDAAHIHPPIGGLGMNTGLQDAFNLGWKLARTLKGPVDLLDSYNEERHRVGEDVVGLTAKRMDAATSGQNVDSNKEQAEQDANSQLSITYRGGSLCAGAIPAGDCGPQPGDRMPFIDGLRRAFVRRDTRFIDLMRPSRFVLLTYGGSDTALVAAAREGLGADVDLWRVAAEDTEDVPTLLDPAGHVTQALGIGPGAVLVRPDGHVAWRGRDAADLEAALRRF